MAIRAMIVDDSGSARETIRNHLECIGCEVVVEAENTAQALDLFRTVRPALVALEVALSRVGAAGALALLRLMRREAPHTPIIVMSALPLPEMRRSFDGEGAFDYLAKPFDAGDFKRVRLKLEDSFPELRAQIHPRADGRMNGRAKPLGSEVGADY